MRAVPAQFHQAVAVRTGGSGAHRRRERMDRVLPHHPAADPPGARSARHSGVHVRVERLLLGAVSHARRRRRADHRGRGRAQGSMDDGVESGVGGLDPRGAAFGGDVLRDAEALRRGADVRGDEGVNAG
ncbi:hypothetical protein PT2222_70182 [Paraburkholderia tropica]